MTSIRELGAVIVTGCSSGIGLAISLHLTRLGFQVFGFTRSKQNISVLVESGVVLVAVNLESTASIHSALTQVRRKANKNLFALINNAGYNQFGALEDLSKDALHAQFTVNTYAAYELTSAALSMFRRQGYGRVIQISSMQSQFAMPYQGMYCASKAALEILTDAFRLECHGTGIRFSIVQVGPTVSNLRNRALHRLEQTVDVSKSIHRKRYLKLQKKLGSQGDNAFEVDPHVIARVVGKSLMSRKPSIRYRVGIRSKLMRWIRLVLTDSVFDRFVIVATTLKR